MLRLVEDDTAALRRKLRASELALIGLMPPALCSWLSSEVGCYGFDVRY